LVLSRQFPWSYLPFRAAFSEAEKASINEPENKHEIKKVLIGRLISNAVSYAGINVASNEKTLSGK
jgi:hypothetical protein